MIKILSIIFVFGICSVFAQEEAKKEADYTDLFKQLDTVISAKKNAKNIEKSKDKLEEKNVSKRERNYREFNEAAKKNHILTAKNLIKSVDNLINEYKKKSSANIPVQRYSSIGSKKIAYVSSKALTQAISSLEKHSKTLDNLKNHKALLLDIENFNIRTISKVIILVEQDIMNIRGLGLKNVVRKKKKESADLPMRLKENMNVDGVKVVSINRSRVKIKSLE